MKNLILAFVIVSSGNVYADQIQCNSRSYQVASQGGDKGNGGFLFSKTSQKLLEESQKQLQFDLARMIEKTKNERYTSDACSKVVDLNQLATNVNELISYEYLAESEGINLNQRSEPRFFHLNENKKVEATNVFFVSFVDTYFRYQDEKSRSKKLEMLVPIKTGIIHEALHLQKYNEVESQACSTELVNKIRFHSCDPEANAKRIATIIVNAHFKHTARGHDVKTLFTEEELFGSKDFESLQDLMDNLYLGKEMKKARSGLIGDNSIILAIISADIQRNVLQVNPKNPNRYFPKDTPFSEYKCK